MTSVFSVLDVKGALKGNGNENVMENVLIFGREGLKLFLKMQFLKIEKKKI